MKNKLIIKYLTIFILWIGGMNVCMAQGSTCATYNCDAGETCYDTEMDIYLGGPAPRAPICLGTDCSGPLKEPYCTAMGMIIPSGALAGASCDDLGAGAQTLCATILPLSDASFLLVFLLSIYGFFIYRKRVAMK